MVVGQPARPKPARTWAPGRTDPVDRLYSLRPALFVAERRALVAAAEAAGDTTGAGRLASLAKPTIAAWMVNLLALRRPDLVDDLLALGAALREAQRLLWGERLRELAPYRRELLRALTGHAHRLAVEAGRAGGATAPLAQVEATLAAALADPLVADLLRTARLTRAVSYSGFGEIPQPLLRLVGAGVTGAGSPARDRRGTGRRDRTAGRVAGPATAGSATVLAFDRGRGRGDGESAPARR